MWAGETESNAWEAGTVVRLNAAAWFGYVRSVTRQETFIFVVVRALKHSEMRLLAVGTKVRFRVGGGGRVNELHPH